MKATLRALLALLCSHLACWLPSYAQEARNPIIYADVPDVSMIRVGDAYYMSSTTMHMSPGLPIMKSKDLVNWEILNYAYERLGENDELNLANGRNAYGRGSWASSIRHHDGVYYVSTFSSTTGKTYIYHTKDIENEPWREISFEPSLHDSSLFFDDDGKAYMIWGAGSLRLAELRDDLTGLKGEAFNEVVIENASAPAGDNIMLGAEGSQLFKHDGKYYLFNITWPRGGMRTVVLHRADKITGPWEGRVVLQDQGVAQGGMVDAPDDKWYAYLFQDHGAVGRVPYLVPMRWEDGWPVLGVDGKVPMSLDLPASKGLVPGIVNSDEFDRKEGDRALPLVWQWNHNPDNERWTLTDRPGFLRVTTGRVDKNVLATRNMLTQRTIGPECTATIAVDVSGMKDGDLSGLCLLQQNYGVIGIQADGDSRQIVMIKGAAPPRRSRGQRQTSNDAPVEAPAVEAVPLDRNMVYLRAACDFRNKTDKARFSYSLDGAAWTSLGDELPMSYTLPHFMGYRFGLFTYASKEAGGFADFDFFRISDKLAGDN